MAYYSATGAPGSLSRGASTLIRSEFALIAAGFNLLPVPGAITAGYANYVVDTGIANAYIVAPVNLTTMVDGLTLRIKFINANSGPSTVTLTGVTGGASIPIVRPDGSALSTGDILAGAIVECSYSSTMGKFQLAVSSAAAVAAAAASATAAASSASGAAASAATAAGYATSLNGTSATSILIGTGSKSFTASTGKQWGAGSFVNIASAANNANFMYGQVTSYNSGTGALVVNVLQIGGSGTFADWVISLSVALPSAATTSDLVNQTPTTFTTGGASTAYTGTPTPAISSYTTGMVFQVTFNQASGDQPTLQISGVATPPQLVYQKPDGSFANIRANMITANHRSAVKLLSASQAWVVTLPVEPSAAGFNTANFIADFTMAFADNGSLKTHNSGSPHTVTIPANASVPMDIGSTMTIYNPGAQGNVSIAITTDSLVWLGSGSTGPRTLAPFGMATITKVAATTWVISGVNLT